MSYQFKASEEYWKNFYALPNVTKNVVRKKWRVFKENPFDSALNTHKIHKLSARYRKTIYSCTIESDLRVVFFIDEDIVFTVDIGTHEIYK